MKIHCILVAASLAVCGCAMTPLAPPSRLTAAADPHRRVPPLRLANAGAGTVTFRPVGPSGWGEAPPDASPKPADATPKPADEILKSKKAKP